MEHPWYDFVSNRRLLCETDSRPFTCIVRERQLRLYEYVARYPELDPAHRVLSVRDNPVWRRPRGRPQLLWLEQVDKSCQELLRIGRGPAWRLARRNPRVWRRRVGDATHPAAYTPFDCVMPPNHSFNIVIIFSLIPLIFPSLIILIRK